MKGDRVPKLLSILHSIVSKIGTEDLLVTGNEIVSSYGTYCCVILLYHRTCTIHTLPQIMQWKHGVQKTKCYLETDIHDVTLLLSWNYHHYWTMLNVVRPKSTIWCRCYALCMNDKCVLCAREVRLHNMNMCKIIRIPWKCIQRIQSILFPLIVVSFISFWKHITVICKSCI